MAIRNPGATTLDTLAALVRSVLEKAFAILGKLDGVATTSDLVQTKAELASAIANNEVDLSPVLTKLDAMAGAGARVGEVRQFLRSKVPPDWREFPGMLQVPENGYMRGIGISSGSGYGVAVYVAEGVGVGLWRGLGSSGWSRWNIENATQIGSTIPHPRAVASLDAQMFAVAIGKYIYFGGGKFKEFYRLNTETGVYSALASFPDFIAQCNAVVLADGRILVSATSTGASTGAMASSTGAAAVFYLYDPVTDAPPLKVVVNIGITRFFNGSHTMCLLPDGTVLLADSSSASTTVSLSSTVLTVSGDTLTAAPPADTFTTPSSSSNVYMLLPFPGGAHLCLATALGSAVRTYRIGFGWGEGEYQAGITATIASTQQANVSVIPSGGWVVSSGYSIGGGGLYCGVIITAPYAPDSAVVMARKL